ncbi:MAG: TRAP transporter small permease [Oscillospiraceae bacterium]|nr:TRAP transporter small permease [Oscillospiraceae bacterium]
MLEKIVKKLTGVVSIVSAVGFLFIMVITVCDIVIRYITSDSILGVYEIVERTMVCAVFAGFAYTQTEHAHVQITLLAAKYPAKLKFIMLALNNLLCAAASVFVAYAAAKQAGVALASNYTTGILLIPLYPFYWVEVVSMVVLCIAFLLDMVKSIGALGSQELAQEIQGEWS